MLKNLSRKQVAYVVESMKAYEKFEKKNWLSKTLSNFADKVKKLFSKKIDNKILQAGVKEILEKGANIKITKGKTQDKSREL